MYLQAVLAGQHETLHCSYDCSSFQPGVYAAEVKKGEIKIHGARFKKIIKRDPPRFGSREPGSDTSLSAATRYGTRQSQTKANASFSHDPNRFF
jgi:hypothetical protein